MTPFLWFLCAIAFAGIALIFIALCSKASELYDEQECEDYLKAREDVT